MFEYLKRRFFVSDMINMLKLNYGLNSHPSLDFKYHLSGDVLTLILPSKHQYLLSRLNDEVIITYNNRNEVVSLNKDFKGVENNKRFIRHLRKCFLFIQKREAFNKSISEFSKKASEIVRRHQRQQKSKNKSKESVFGYILHTFDDCHTGDSDSHTGDSHHSHSHHDDY